MAIPKKELDFNMNDDQMRLKISALERELAKIAEGGGKKRIEKLHQSFFHLEMVYLYTLHCSILLNGYILLYPLSKCIGHIDAYGK